MTRLTTNNQTKTGQLFGCVVNGRSNEMYANTKARHQEAAKAMALMDGALMLILNAVAVIISALALMVGASGFILDALVNTIVTLASMITVNLLEKHRQRNDERGSLESPNIYIAQHTKHPTHAPCKSSIIPHTRYPA